MTEAQRSTPTAVLQLPVAFAAVVAVGLDLWIGLALLAALVLTWPPRVALRPLALRPMLSRYLPFVPVWCLLVVGYLQVAHACGHPVLPQPQLVQLAEHGTAMTGFWLTVFGIVVAAPFFEEMLFRGYLFTALEAIGLPMWVTQLVTATLFGLAHGIDYALPIGALALLFGWLRMRHRSLLPCIAAHTVHNGLTVLITLLWPAHLELLYPR